MNELQAFLNGLLPSAQAAFAARCGTTIGYLRKAISKGQTLGEALCINIERESAGRVRCEQLRPSGVDWAFLRGSRPWNSSTHPISGGEQRVANRDGGERPGVGRSSGTAQQSQKRPYPRRSPRDRPG
jgi:DNA-binding transcriptional regulator YdaS (Cro superfamily)